MYQTEFTEEQYRQYETPNICAVCHNPCITHEEVRIVKTDVPGRLRRAYITYGDKFYVGVSNLKDGKKSPIIVKLCHHHASMLLTKPKPIKKAFNSKSKSQLAAQERAGQLRLPFMEE